MMFVQSLNGLSHNAAEDTLREHIEQAAEAFGRLADKSLAWVAAK
jgi:N-carbamoyl-L-amino-acid hydrolase